MLKFETPPVNKISVGDTMNIKLLINTYGVSILNVDGFIVYNPDKLTINSARTGNFLSLFNANSLGSADKYLVSSWGEFLDQAKSSNIDTLWATINVTFKEKGITSISFQCIQGSLIDSNINRATDQTDILDCSTLSSLELNVE